jgi:hypothetical protein
VKRLVALLVLGIACSFATLVATRAEAPTGKTLKPCVVITGADSHVTKCRYQRVTLADEWARVWQDHKGVKPTGEYDLFYNPLALPQIDFDNYMVIAIFQGKGWNSAGLTAVSIIEENNRIVFRFKDKSYQTMGSDPDGGGRKVTVYGFFVVPHSTKPVVLEENTQHEIGEPPVWTERMTFPKL